MANLSSREYGTILRALGWRTGGTTDLKYFQAGWALGSALAADGICGPLTSAALRLSYARHRAGQGTASAHFSFKEFACKCGGRYSSCARIWIKRTQVARMEVYRKRVNGPVSVISGCRCYYHNRAVGGASGSQHMYGTACDVSGVLTVSSTRALKMFAGIGYKRATGRVLHVDSRDVGGHNTTNGRPTSPTTWIYA